MTICLLADSVWCVCVSVSELASEVLSQAGLSGAELLLELMLAWLTALAVESGCQVPTLGSSACGASWGPGTRRKPGKLSPVMSVFGCASESPGGRAVSALRTQCRDYCNNC